MTLLPFRASESWTRGCCVGDPLAQEPCPGDAHFPPESTHLLAKSREPPPKLSPAVRAPSPGHLLRHRLYRTPPFVSAALRALPARNSRRSRPIPHSPFPAPPLPGTSPPCALERDRGGRRSPLCVWLGHGRGPATHPEGPAPCSSESKYPAISSSDGNDLSPSESTTAVGEPLASESKVRGGRSQNPQPRPTRSGFLGAGSEICVFTNGPNEINQDARRSLTSLLWADYGICVSQCPGPAQDFVISVAFPLLRLPLSFYLFSNITQNDSLKTRQIPVTSLLKIPWWLFITFIQS